MDRGIHLIHQRSSITLVSIFFNQTCTTATKKAGASIPAFAGYPAREWSSANGADILLATSKP